jgi:putative nucleotidyltransferase with HDIG domain
MSLQPTFEEQEVLADTLSRDSSAMDPRERATEIGTAGAFFVAVALIWTAQPPHGFEALPIVLSTLVLLVAAAVRIDTPFGFTVPIQLAFVPLLFAMPLAVVPLVVALALALVRVPDVLRGELRPSRLLSAVGNAWFAIGPVAVFVAADVRPQDAGPLLLIAALLAQFAVDFTVSAFRFAIGCGAKLSSQLSESWVYAVDAALSGIALLVAENIRSHPWSALTLLPLLGLLAMFARERHHRLQNLLELNNAYRGTALVLGDVVEADDGYTGEHCKSVVGLALEVGDRFGLSVERRRNLEFGALLHDVGKIAIPKHIINKPGQLDPEEWTIIKTHTIEGQKMLDRVGGFMREVGLIVRSHHEGWDGSGYPDGLAGDAIPLEARIISCCDAWNAMRTDRVYRKALPFDVALGELVSNAGRQFDPEVVEVLAEIVTPAAAAAVVESTVPAVAAEDAVAVLGLNPAI